jgi:hypothetical protein
MEIGSGEEEGEEEDAIWHGTNLAQSAKVSARKARKKNKSF